MMKRFVLKNRGILPRRFYAFVPSPEQQRPRSME
jgi:hypothetical protein